MFRRDFLKTAASAVGGGILAIDRGCLRAGEASGMAPWPDRSPQPPIDDFHEIIPPPDGYYHEPLRPQFHFTSYRGWINDPNGLFYYRGRWNLFFQYQPFSTDAGWDPPYAPFWGWAESDNLLHWRQKPCQFPRTCSGGAAVDLKNDSGLKTGTDDPILLFSGSGVRYSEDGAKSWKPLKIEKNWNADPIVFRDDETGRWFLITFTWPENRTTFHFMTSDNLRDWTEAFTVEREASECPDMVCLPLDGDVRRKKWVFNVGNGGYLVGDLDENGFYPLTSPKRLDWGDAYAFQTWRNAPENGDLASFSDKNGASCRRTVSIAWLQSWTLPGEPFSQQMTFPTEVTLRSFPDGPRVCRQPIREIERLYESVVELGESSLSEETNPLASVSGELFDLELLLVAGDAETITLLIRDYPVEWRIGEGTVFVGDKSMAVETAEGGLRLRLLVDRLSVEVFSGEGENVLSRFTPPRESDVPLALTSRGGSGRLISAKIRKMKSIWP